MNDNGATVFDPRDWVARNWDPDMTVAQWWWRLAESRLASPTLPEPWGRSWNRAQAADLAGAIVAAGALGQPAGIGMMLAVPTMLVHGTPELIERFVPSILNGQHGWCQLFSEPGAGSDLAGLQTRAERDGDEWIVDGQKVWTSGGQWADFGILLARTDPEKPKHRGISYFAFPMRQAGVEVRPLREMTGQAMFNEVFLTGTRVPDADMIGDLNDGWRVANTTLMVERAGIGGANVAAPSGAIPGTVAGHLDKPAGDYVGRGDGALAGAGVGPGRIKQLTRLAQERGKIDEPVVRQKLAELYTLVEITKWHLARAKAAGASSGTDGNLAKLRNSRVLQLARDLGCEILGMDATIVGPGSATGGDLQGLVVFSPAPSIFGGTDQVQRNVIGERALGLPKEPGPSKDTPYRELLQNPSRA